MSVRRPARPATARVLMAIALALTMVVVAVVGVAGPASAEAADGPASAVTGGEGAPRADDGPRRILIVTLPRTTWDVVREHRPPQLTGFLDRAAVASMSTRTVGSRTRPGQAYLTLGSGNRADTLDPRSDGQSADRHESTPAGPATAVYERRTGMRPSGAVLALTFPEQDARNDDLLYGAVPGALGQALGDAGEGIAVFGNADVDVVQTLEGELASEAMQRQVALGAVDRVGQVPVGDVGTGLLLVDQLAPFGLRTDGDALVDAVRRGWDEGTRVALVELSDLERAEQARQQSTSEQGDAQFARALAHSDEILGRLLEDVDLTRDLVMVLGPTAPLAGEELTVFGMRGPGVEPGWARSSTTRRAAFVTLTDVAPTVLGRLGIDPPDSMTDTRISSVGNDLTLSDRMDTMARDDERAVFRDATMGPVTVSFIVLLVVMLALVAAAVSRFPGWAGPLEVLALVVLAVPVAAYLSGLLPYGPFITFTFALTVLGIAVLLALAARAIGRREAVASPLVISSLCVVLLVTDILTGGNLQISTLFGYSPIVAGRFAGLGNQAFSLLSVSSLLVATAAWELAERRHPGGPIGRRLVLVGALFAVVVVADGTPQFGSDVGGVLASVPAFAVCMLLLSGRRIRLRVAALIGAATVGVLVAFAAVDLARPTETRTHLGRFAAKVVDGDVVTILQRKLQANLNVLTSTVWTLVIPAALIFFAYLTWRPNPVLRRIHDRHLGFRPFGISALTLGVLAWALNDSGVSMPAMMLTVALPYTAYLALDGLRRPEHGAEEPAGPGRDRTERDGTERDGAGGAGTEPAGRERSEPAPSGGTQR